MNRFTKSLPWTVLLLVNLLAACVSKPELPLISVDIQDPANAYAWEITGKILVKTADDKVSASLYWLHAPMRDDMRLTSMLGTSLLSMTVTPVQTSLTADGKTYRDDDPEPLLQRLSGWRVPVTQLPNWLTGQFGDANILKRDANGRPCELLSKGPAPWHIRVQSRQANNLNIPRLMLVSRPGIELKIQINRWQALALADAPVNNRIKS
ncbi:MAG: lipoprotein insertase outer membrane protein LolB [Shewanella sp.]|nr:lipoprotein insertase outer membrane protein LolB [Shewanella sp.]MCF1429862.1 lipoprotein insertase outer membrane protein LolB [Shewanella sp.]MCF1438927.1 lipoprotein insertase outer membrane protein LolB [Shewanella sp.]MCF1457828.1 lipoprotein insertase outer membrane protein LolB [Shewanella sp.]